jgi:hypothetical protein
MQLASGYWYGGTSTVLPAGRLPAPVPLLAVQVTTIIITSFSSLQALQGLHTTRLADTSARHRYSTSTSTT